MNLIHAILLAGYILGGSAILLSAAALIWTVVDRHMGPPAPSPDPDPPAGRRTPAPQLVFHDTPAPPNYTRGDRVHAWWVEQADAVTEVIDVVEAPVVILEKFLGDQDEPDTEPDPLDDTVELPAIADIESPLYYRLRPPAPLDLESFTTGWKRADLLARIKEVHDADHR